jgi:hypothetical protein
VHTLKRDPGQQAMADLRLGAHAGAIVLRFGFCASPVCFDGVGPSSAGSRCSYAPFASQASI